MKRNLWLLAVCQGLFLTNNVTFIAINGLVGLALAPVGWMATLPITGYVAGGAIATGLVARHHQRHRFFTKFRRGQFGGGKAVQLRIGVVKTRHHGGRHQQPEVRAGRGVAAQQRRRDGHDQTELKRHLAAKRSLRAATPRPARTSGC